MAEHLVSRFAMISSDGLYRYWLGRRWDHRRHMVFIMLNPSTADGKVDDPTIRRCMGFAQREGCGGLEVINLYALRATKPIHLLDLHTTTPEMRKHLGEVADELAYLRRDLTSLGERPLAVVTELEKAAPAPKWRSRSAKPNDGRTTKGREKYPDDRNGERFCPTHDGDEGPWLPLTDFAFQGC